MNNKNKQYIFSNGSRDKEIIVIPDNIEMLKFWTKNGFEFYEKYFNMNEKRYMYVLNDWDKNG